MKFIVSSSELLKQLQLLSGVVSNNNTLAILDNFLFDLQGSVLTLTASDLETTVSTRVSVTGESEGKICVPAKLLTDTIKTFPEQPLTIRMKEEENLFEIVSEQGNYSFGFEKGDEFPVAPELESPSKVKLSNIVLKEAINKTLFAAGNDELRPVMTGVLFQLGIESCTFVATDAHKLVKYTRKDIQATENAEFIVPQKTLNIIKNASSISTKLNASNDGDDVTIEYNQVNARFTFGNTTFICRLIDGKYPNYQAVIPTENPNVLTIDRIAFLNSIRRLSIFSNKTTHQIKLDLNGNNLQLSAEDIDFSNKAEERLSCDYAGENLIIGFNSKILSEMLSILNTEDVTLEMSEPNRAGIIKPMGGLEEGEEILMLVMPIMINES